MDELMLPQGLDFTSTQLEQIEDFLHQLSWETEAQCVLLADVTGQLISVIGKVDMNTAVLSALAAGNLAATKEMARLVGEPARFKLLLHEGEKRSVYLSDVGAELVLITVFDNRIPIGLVRLATQQTVQQLEQVVEETRSNNSELPGDLADSLTGEFEASWDSVFGS
ncbi:MAG: roadblock/LC7 domain-containing protein [Anaerolineales bacterium]|nr:roadblock/LC7 domain-containing protein [Anaerolineales bacterium]